MSPELETIAARLFEARLPHCPGCAVPELSLTEAFAVAAHNHQRRMLAGERPCGRKIGHTNPATWGALGLSEPSWGWLYESSTHIDLQGVLKLGPRREPKLEAELVLHLGRTPPAGARAEELADCVDQMALGLELVDRPYPDWNFSVAASVAAAGVHAGLFLGPSAPFEAALAPALAGLTAELQLDTTSSQGGSGLVLGSPLEALARLSRLLRAQQAPALRAGEWVTTGALAPALPVRAGMQGEVRLQGLALSPLRFRVA